MGRVLETPGARPWRSGDADQPADLPPALRSEAARRGCGSLPSDAARARHDIAARSVRAGAVGGKRAADPCGREPAAGGGRGAEPAEERRGGDAPSVSPRARAAWAPAKPRRREGPA